MSEKNERARDFLQRACEAVPAFTSGGLQKVPYSLRDAVALVMQEYADAVSDELLDLCESALVALVALHMEATPLAVRLRAGVLKARGKL